MYFKSQFTPAWWLKNCHLQTMAAKFFRRNEAIDVVEQTIELDDGDFIDIAWTQAPSTATTNQPIALVLHGLEGSVNSHYAKGMLKALSAQGWLGVLMHFRGCSGRPNRQARSYHSGDTRDVHFFTRWLTKHFPQHPLAAIGFSLGGNVLAKYLAEHPDTPIQASAVICAPLHLASCSRRINKGASKIYQKYLVDMLRNSTLTKIDNQLINTVCPKKLQQAKTMFDFDDLVTAPINGFNSASDYYQQASAQFVLKKITKPTLIIHADDDPFLCHQSITSLTSLPDNITFEVTHGGGHVGFISGSNPLKPEYWLEQRVPKFLQGHTL